MKRLLAVSLFTLAAVALAQSKTDMRGTWKLNTAKSDFGGESGPRELTVKVERCDTVLKYTLSGTTQDGNPIDDSGLEVPLDGKDHPGPGGEGVLNFRWEGPTLVGEMRRDSERMIKVTVVPSDDGKSMMRNVEFKMPGGGFKQKEVYDRQ